MRLTSLYSAALLNGRRCVGKLSASAPVTAYSREFIRNQHAQTVEEFSCTHWMICDKSFRFPSHRRYSVVPDMNYEKTFYINVNQTVLWRLQIFIAIRHNTADFTGCFLPSGILRKLLIYIQNVIWDFLALGITSQACLNTCRNTHEILKLATYFSPIVYKVQPGTILFDSSGFKVYEATCNVCFESWYTVWITIII